jgi:pimeloyl-ACP methyl ester carboxylesterase
MKWLLTGLSIALVVSACASNPAPAGAAVQNGLVNVNGGTLYYETLGKGAPVILIHGGFGDRRMWDDQFTPLAQAFKVIRYDHRGFGKSPAAGQTYSPVDDLVKLMDHLDLKRANLVGNSMGGTLALDFALLQPMRTGAVVVIASTAAGYPTPEEDRRSVETVMNAARRDGTGAAVDLWLKHPMVNVTATHPDAGPRLRTMIQDNQRLFLNEHWPAEPVSPPTYERLVELKANVLFIVGDRDVAAVRDGARASAARIKGAKVETISGADHLPQMVAPDRVNKLLVDYISLNGC